jgi:O-antigen biosynthesis protein
VLEHAHRLRTEHGMDVALVRTLPSEHAWRYERLEGVEVLDLASARERRFDVAVATWWETAYELFSIDAARYAYFVQSIEDRFFQPGNVRRMLAGATHSLPVAFITEARWIANLLRERNGAAPVFYVRNGVAKEIFAPPDSLQSSRTGPLRILVEGHPGVWFKGVKDALAAADAMKEPHETTLVTTVPWQDVDGSRARVLGPVPMSEMPELYANTDVVLKLSHVEGMFGPPLEGFHLGATCVVTPVTGHDEYVVHGWNGVVADWDDLAGAARWLDLLARDRRLLHYLRWNALATARSWPSWKQSSQFLAAALRRIHSLPQPDVPRAVSAMLHDLEGSAVDVDVRRLTLERRLAEAEATAANATHRMNEAVQELSIRTGELDALHRTKAYRAAIAMRAVWKHPVVQALTAPLRWAYRGLRRLGRR